MLTENIGQEIYKLAFACGRVHMATLEQDETHSMLSGVNMLTGYMYAVYEVTYVVTYNCSH